MDTRSLFRLRGFTLIELLIVIAVLGVLATVVLVGIDPVEKINQANDSKVQTDIGFLGRAEEAYAATHNGYYADGPEAQAILVSNGNLKSQLSAPTGYNDYNIACTSGIMGSACESVKIYTLLKSKKYINNNTPYWIYCTNVGKAGATANGDTCP